MHELLEPIVNSPDFPAHVTELQRLLAEERARRERFYEEMTEDGSSPTSLKSSLRLQFHLYLSPNRRKKMNLLACSRY